VCGFSLAVVGCVGLIDADDKCGGVCDWCGFGLAIMGWVGLIDAVDTCGGVVFSCCILYLSMIITKNCIEFFCCICNVCFLFIVIACFTKATELST